jgi:hypothetical protein
MGKQGRPPRAAGGEKKHIHFSERQLTQLNALREIAPYGKPSFQALIEKAVDIFLEDEMAKPGVREKVAQYLADQPKVVALRDVSANGSKKG